MPNATRSLAEELLASPLQAGVAHFADHDAVGDDEDAFEPILEPEVPPGCPPPGPRVPQSAVIDNHMLTGLLKQYHRSDDPAIVAWLSLMRSAAVPMKKGGFVRKDQPRSARGWEVLR